ncbi:MAG: TonB-dependent receptor [Acidobacteria bacterium]|nr:TonB-dependent receptor [Acidobacteriota bacterium]
MVAFARAALPAPTFTGVGDRNARDATPAKEDQNEWTVRVDHVLGDKDSVWFRYSAFRLDSSSSGGIPALRNMGKNRGENWAASWVRAFSPTTVLQAQYGRAHLAINTLQRFVDLPADFDKQVGFADIFSRNFQGPDKTLFPGIRVRGFFGVLLGGESNQLNPNMSDIHQVKANVSKNIGNHTYKFGGELNSSNFEAFLNWANVTFISAQTANPLTGAGGSEAASWLLNLPDDAERRNVHETLRWGGVMGIYFMDSWKATSKLTVNLGLRYDRTFQPGYGRNDSRGENGGIETGNYDLQRGKYIIQVPVPFCSERGRPPCIPGTGLPANVEISATGKSFRDTTDNWQPRVGLAYRLSQNTALRASFQMFFDNWAGVNQAAQGFQGSWPDVAQQRAANLNNQLSTSVLPNRQGTNPLPEAGLPAPDPFGQVNFYRDPNIKNPYSMQWNLGLQHQLNSSTVVTANYVGSGSRRLVIGGIYNTALTPGPGNPRDRAPFPYIQPTFYDRSWGRSNYHAFQFLLDKKLSKGLAYMVSYTWSKAIDIGSSGWFGVEGQSVQDPYNFNNDRGVAGFDLPHVLTVNWIYQLPFGPRQQWNPSNKVLSHIIGNWQVNGIVLFHSGVPFNLTANDRANTGNFGIGGQRPDYIGGETTLSTRTPAKWFNTSAFAIPALFKFGSAGRHILRRDGMENLDLSIFRQFPILESRRLEFRAEMFNALNHPVFGTPNGNVNSANFGRVFGIANQPRQIQLALKFIF